MMEPEIKIDMPISKDTAKNILEPTLVPLSQALGGIIQWVFQKPIEYGITNAIRLNNLKEQTEHHLNQIPPQNRTSENLGLTLKAFEDSRYQLNDELISSFFAKLISGTLDDRKNISPYFSTVLKEMSSDDALLLKYFFDKRLLFESKIISDSPFVHDDRFRVFSESKYFSILTEPNFDLYRETDNLAEDFYDEIEQIDATKSVLFLLSKQLIEIVEEEQWNAMIPAVEKKSLDNDSPMREWLNKHKNSIYRKQTDFETSVYRLSPLGMSLADSVLNTD